jgi:hypothetical protein
MFEAGKIAETLFLVVSVILTLYFYTTKSKIPDIRRIPAIDAIDEAISRATEMGRPVHVSSGMPQIVGSGDPMTMAGMSIVSHVAKVCARQDTRVIATAYKPEQNVMQMDVVRAAYVAEGKAANFNPNDCLFLDGRAYEAGVMGLIQDENCAANINVGYLRGGVALTFMPYAFKGDVIQIGGSATVTNIPHLAALCDYLLISEDIFAAEAYLTREKNKLNALFAQDVYKFIILGFVVIATIAAIAGFTGLADLVAL